MVRKRSETRKLLEAEFGRIKAQIIRKIRPDKIVLFGSLARQDVNGASDIDILVIKKTDKPFKERRNELYSLIDYHQPTDMFYYTPAEIRRMKGSNSFIRHALQNGRVVYEKKR